MVSFTVLSIFSLHTQWMGFVGSFIKNIYFGLFSFAGYGLPYFILVLWFYRANQHLVPYRKKGTWGLFLLFLSLVFIINILNFDVLKGNFIDGPLSILSFEGIKTLYTNGIALEGSGFIGSLLGYYSEALIGIVGLYILILTLWILSFILLTNIKITEKIKNLIHLKRTKSALKKRHVSMPKKPMKRKARNFLKKEKTMRQRSLRKKNGS